MEGKTKRKNLHGSKVGLVLRLNLRHFLDFGVFAVFIDDFMIVFGSDFDFDV